MSMLKSDKMSIIEQNNIYEMCDNLLRRLFGRWFIFRVDTRLLQYAVAPTPGEQPGGGGWPEGGWLLSDVAQLISIGFNNFFITSVLNSFLI